MAEAIQTNELSGEQLQELQKKALETWPLYRHLDYRGAPHALALPLNIWLHCPNCDGTQRFSRPTHLKGTNHVRTHRGRFGDEQYSCCNCPGPTKSVVHFFYSWTYDGERGAFQKVGQWPPVEETVPKALKDRLDKEDLDLYKTALRLRNYNLGIGAVSYLRRVVENRINDMLDVLAAAAKEHDFAVEELAKIKTVKASHRFDQKIDYAARLLPSYLKPAGKPNPIDKLHELTSDGLHSKTEAECVDIFDKVRTVFEYVFGNLQAQTEEARAFVKTLGDL